MSIIFGQIFGHREAGGFWAEFGTLGFWLDVGVAVVTVVALMWAIRTATRAERKALAMAAAERRQTFDLEVLRDLIETLNDDVIADMLRRPEQFYRLCRARLAMLAPEDLPTWRAFEHVRADDIAGLARLLGLESRLRGNAIPSDAEVLLEARPADRRHLPGGRVQDAARLSHGIVMTTLARACSRSR